MRKRDRTVKIDRLIGILTCLLQTDKTTAPALARRFEVSSRTILRDVEALCKAGIPIVTAQGGDGGISVMEGYRLDKSLLTENDLQVILTGLQGIQSVSKSEAAEVLFDKLLPKNRAAAQLQETMQIDLSSFYKDSLSEKIDLLQRAVSGSKRVRFRYYYSKGEAVKTAEPYQLVFKWSDWYLFAFCPERQDFRLYKLKRLWELSMCAEGFLPRAVPEEKRRFGSHMTDDYFITAVFAPGEKYKLVEEYGPDSFTVLPDGRLWMRRGFTDLGDAVLWFLGFGDRVQVLEPPEAVERLRALAQKITRLYE